MEKRLKWRCRRGMKELDLLLTGYLENLYPSASCEQKRAFTKLLGYQDCQIIDLVFGRISDDDPAVQTLIEQLKRCRPNHRCERSERSL